MAYAMPRVTAARRSNSPVFRQIVYNRSRQVHTARDSCQHTLDAETREEILGLCRPTSHSATSRYKHMHA